jgi:hypothetical protein
MVLVGRDDRNQALALSERLVLPCALLDGVPIGSDTIKQTARDFDVEWLDVTRDPWTPALLDWLRAASDKAKDQ